MEQEQEERLGQVLTLALVLGASFLASCGQEEGRAPTRSSRAAQAVTAPARHGWRGTAEIEGGVRVDVEVARLHDDAERQGFDARALRSALVLDEGEPFVLDARRSEVAGAPLNVVPCVVSDERGVALRSIAPAAGGPLATLVAPPSAPLAPGESERVVLWGRAPGENARVRLGGDVEVALAPADLASPGASWLARVASAGEGGER